MVLKSQDAAMYLLPLQLEPLADGTCVCKYQMCSVLSAPAMHTQVISPLLTLPEPGPPFPAAISSLVPAAVGL